MVNQKLVVDFDELEGDLIFSTGNLYDRLIIEIDEILGLSETYDHNVKFSESGRNLHISIYAFLEGCNEILEIIKNTQEYEITEAAREIIIWSKKLLMAEDIIRPELSKEELQSKLDEAGWNSQERGLSDFQMENLIQTSRRDNAAIFSVPGAGKTVESLAFSSIVGGRNNRFIIVCPRNAYSSWESELKASLNLSDNQILRATGTDNELRGKLMVLNQDVRAVLLNYNRLHYRYRFFSEYIRWLKEKGDTVITIFDESHHFKGGKAFTSAVYRISPFASHRVLLSGTPMPKESKDLVHQFRALLPYMVNDIHEHNVTSITQDRFVRTTKTDLNLIDPKIRYVDIEMDKLQGELYKIITDYYAAERATKGKITSMAKIGRIRTILVYLTMHVSNPLLKRDLLSEIFENANPDIYKKLVSLQSNLDDYGPKVRYACQRARKLVAEGKKVLIWSTFVDNVDFIAAELDDLGALYIRGDVPTEEFNADYYFKNPDKSWSESEEEELTREQRIHEFKTNNECMVLVANPAAAGEGISLHDVCHHAIYVDRYFDARAFMQSMDRIHRYGKDDQGNIICQRYETTIEILRCLDSIDMVIDDNLQRKMTAMYAWLNDTSLSPQLNIFLPDITDEDIDRIFLQRQA
ncbi:DEAD/DEAH box helicase [Euryarchaeota archaeon]|nr:DEAD/DEAH box helicase [Euryarchaeota archaeon]